jgi:putative tricarboxylic transport membrane protein
MKRGLTGRWILGMGAMALLFLPFPVTEVRAAGEWKPTKSIQFVVPYAAGGGSDVLARTLAGIIEAEKLSPQRLVIVNMPGGGTTIGTTNVAQAKGNPHMLLTFISGQVTAPMVAGKGAATFRELTMIAGLALDEQLIVVKSDSRFKSIKDVVEESKKKDNTLTIAGGGKGAEDQMCNRLFERAAGIQLRYVPFNSGGECVTALLGGHVDMIWANPSEFMPQYEAKMVRPLVVAKENRIPEFPDVPTFRDNGYDVTFKFFRGIAAPPGIPAEAVAFYEKMMKQVVDSPAWKERYLKKYLLSPGWLGSKEFTQSVTHSEGVFREILKDLGFVK